MAIFDGGSSDYPLHPEGKFRGFIREVVAIPPKVKHFPDGEKIQYGRLVIVENGDGQGFVDDGEGKKVPASATMWYGLYADEGKTPFVGSKSKPFKLYATILGRDPELKPFDDEQILGTPVEYFVETSEDGQYSNVISLKHCKDTSNMNPDFKPVTQAERAVMEGEDGGTGQQSSGTGEPVAANGGRKDDDLPF